MFTEIKPKKVFFTELVERIWEVNGDLQRAMLEEFSRSVRPCNWEQLVKYKAFFIPHDMYLINLVGSDICTPQYGMYFGDRCYFNKRLVIPIVGFDGYVHSFVGYDNGDEILDPDEKLKHAYYLYQSKQFFAKDRYLFIRPEEYKLAWERKYICITDGIFDNVSCNGVGHPTCALMSSRFTWYHQNYLRYIPTWVLLCDNDDAGDYIERVCKKINHNSIRLRFDETKDIDDLIHKGLNGNSRYLQAMQELDQMGYLIDWNIR